MSDAMIARVVERLRALADGNRVRILLRLKQGPLGVGELADELGIGQPSVSKHLSVLKAVGLVDAERKGAAAFYSVRDPSIFQLCKLVCDGVTRFAQAEHAALGLPPTNHKRSK